MPAFSLFGLGLLLGLRHATDADHVAAVATLVSRSKTARAALPVAALWGVGHGATLLLVGGALVVFRWAVPPRLGLACELAVGVMLVVLGVLGLREHRYDREGAAPRRLRSVVTGAVHGLSGSAAAALLVLGTVGDTARACMYLVVFAAGTLAGMVGLTLALLSPALVMSRHHGRARRAMAIVPALGSIALGVAIMVQTSVGEGLFAAAPAWVPR